ncbi:IMPACT family protein [Gellertiella hungarica]|uniref:Putative YigZ family protein n=1 Tax=Gellertiella hungarica TaxID=1572859 RepID=A0A7W6J9F8_9HYPH|nr:YigZ family protein [Gellertiella hungarica]MBB4066377.1 putative YigZ family protein [Gellertiella hungarica]
MFMLTEAGSFAQEIKKSRFIAHAGPVATEEEARAFIAAHADPAATHNCWAYRIGPRVRFNDDGEVGGTAGKPILQVIEGNALDHVVVLVIRHYGGVLLGTGGLVRAYGGTAGECLKRLGKGPIVLRTAFSVTCDFNDMAVLKARLLPLPGLSLDAEDFAAEGAVLRFSLPADRLEPVSDLIRDLSRGRARVKVEP